MSDYREEKRQADARIAQLRKIFHTYAIAAGGGGAALIVTKGPNGSVWAWVGIILALALHTASIYLAPIAAEKSDND